MNQHLYQLILEYKMTKEEALALRLCDCYMEMSRKYFPEYKHATLPKKGDPRKSMLFRYCWTLQHKTKDKLKLTDYPLYIQAQMSILKNIKFENSHPYIDPNCLVGEAAWKRWQVWSSYFNQIKQTDSPIKVDKKELSKEISKALSDSHYALTARLGELTQDNVYNSMPLILRLVRMNVVSPFFIALSPIAKKYIEDKKPLLGFELPTNLESMTEYYKELFNNV